MQSVLEKAKRLLREKKINRKSESFWIVGDEDKYYNIYFKIKKGRTIYACDCKNYVMYCNEKPICSHVVACLLYETTKNFQERVNKLIKDYESFKSIKMKPDWNSFIQELKDMRKFL